MLASNHRQQLDHDAYGHILSPYIDPHGKLNKASVPSSEHFWAKELEQREGGRPQSNLI